jgi:succinate dehydrogenase flavin-adding protein (antitoxin of CptAB toxin-antitoxin module)
MTSETTAARRRRLIYRSRYTGMKETDLLLGPFAERYVPGFSTAQLDCYEHLLAAADPDIFDWATGRQPVPPEYDTEIMSLLRNFKTAS